MKIELPYPPPGLNPNARLHWAKKYKIDLQYRSDWWAEFICIGQELAGKTQFRITFAPPDKKRRDIDNVIASLKSGIDQLSRHTGVDDSKFKIDWAREFLPPVKGGAVYLEIIG